MKNIHLIAIGGSAMHNLALALHHKGFVVTGSDDEIAEPSLSRLKAKGLLPASIGWFPEKIHAGLDAIILGMHARADNPELIKAKELGLKIFSYPEYIYEQSQDKKRVVIGGSHGKTTITAMVLHAMQDFHKDVDYMVGAKLQGFDTMVKLTKEADTIVIEGDEYLSSPIDRRPKFHLYQPHIALISGIAWDHINVFPTFENYVQQFEQFIALIEKGGTLIYCENDPILVKLVKQGPKHLTYLPYSTPQHHIINGVTILDATQTALKIFGQHNLMNLEGARLICSTLGMSSQDFYASMSTFGGADRRLEKLGENSQTAVYKDFAHSPSKLKATTTAMKEQYPNRRLIACMELHTFSSLNENFLKEYDGAMKMADEAWVYFNPKTIEHKKLNPISIEDVKTAFNTPNIKVFTSSEVLTKAILAESWHQANLLLMSSGTFDGLNLVQISHQVLSSAS